MDSKASYTCPTCDAQRLALPQEATVTKDFNGWLGNRKEQWKKKRSTSKKDKTTTKRHKTGVDEKDVELNADNKVEQKGGVDVSDLDKKLPAKSEEV